MSSRVGPSGLTLVAVAVALLPGLLRASPQPPADPESSSLTDIALAFKLDPRVLGPTYGGERWVSPPTYRANAQDTVEARARGVDASGRLVDIHPEWIPSDPEMVTVSPTEGKQVQITVKRAGESTLTVAAPGVSKELMIEAKEVGAFLQLEIRQPTTRRVPSPARPVAPASTFDPPDASTLKSQKERLSYAVGMNLGNAARKQSIEIDPALVREGLEDALSGGELLLSEQEAQAALLALQNELKTTRLEAEAERQKELAETNKKEGEAFLAENAKQEGVVTLPSGLQYKVLEAGEGGKPTDDDVVVECRYRLTGIDGTELASSRGRPATMSLAPLIPGWREALKLMPVGSKWQLFVPSELAYGERGRRAGRVSGRAIAPNATLVFEVELISIKGEPSSKATGQSRW